MKINILYSVAALHEAAAYIWDNNPRVPVWSPSPKSPIDIVKMIHGMMIKQALYNAKVIMKEKRLEMELPEEWGSFVGTGGFYIAFELQDVNEEEINIGVDILVDPAIASNIKGFVTEVIDMSEEEV